MPLSRISQIVGTVLQDPERQILGAHVFTEVAFGLENLGLPRDEIRQRVDETLEYLGIAHLRNRETFYLSGGEKQKVSLAGVLAMRPDILLLDEPLASLDPASAQEALALFRRLADEGVEARLAAADGDAEVAAARAAADLLESQGDANRAAERRAAVAETASEE